MSIATAIQNAQQKVANAYTAVSNKGGTLPSTQNLSNLPTAISSIPAGGGSKYGATMDGMLGDVDANGVLQHPTTLTDVVFTGVEDIADDVLSYKFYQSPAIRSISFPDLTSISGILSCRYMAYSCINLTSVDLSSLVTISGRNVFQYAFYQNTNLTSVDLSSLTSISGNTVFSYAFASCTSLTSVDLSSLTMVSGNYPFQYAFYQDTDLTSVDLSNLITVTGSTTFNTAFSGCTNLTNVLFNNLQIIGADVSGGNYGHFMNCFTNCNNLTSLSFPKLEKIYCTGSGTSGTFTSNNTIQKFYFPKLDTITYGTGASSSNQAACKNIFYGCTALTELHFGRANQSAIEASPGYSTAWGRGAGNVTIYFDL